jgi:predicted RNase H-like HicB family nuclease
MYQAIEMHIKGLREDGLPVPESTSFAAYSDEFGHLIRGKLASHSD